MLTCPRCGRENPEDFRFCGACAAPLQSETAERREERKVVTVLFCDLVGSTAQAERMDPEDVRALLSRYHERVRTELELFGGTVEKFIGDAVMALFGAPVAHEDDPERAVRAALAIQEAVAAEAGSQLRIGIATGEALVALGARPAEGEGMAAGDVVNTAARLQTAAPAGGILVEEATYRATERAIAFTSLPAVEAKGKAAPIPVWRADQAKARLGSDSGGVVRTQLVGRDDELAALVAALNRAIREREPQLATLVGVPGIGKSRLVYELLQHVDSEPQPVCWRQGRSLPYGEGMPMWALAEIVKSHAGILESDSAEVVAEKLASAVAHVFDEDPEWIESHLGPVVGVGSDADASGDRRDESFAAWRRFLEGIAETSPLVLVFEDLHWSHDHLLDFVEHLAEWATGVPMLILGTSRPELLSRRPDWGGGTSNALTLRLSALTDEDTARLVHGLLARSVLPAGVQAVLLERAAGNPLYAEEFVRVVVERGAAVADELPESIQGIIAARLDAAAADEKAVLQDAAVVGKVFWEGAVAAIGAEDRPLDALLHALVRKDFVRRERRSAVAGEVEYSFRHALVRDVAYGQIPRVDRIEKHRRAAGWIETLGRPDDHAEMMAHHYMAALELAEASGQDTAELDERARIVLRRSGDRALALNAFPDAARFYRQALEMWPQDDPARADLLFACGTALRWADGTGDDLIAEAASAFITRADLDAVAAAEILLSDIDVERGDFAGAQERLRTVARRLADQPRSRGRASVLAHIARLHLLRSDLPEAERIGREAAAMAQELGAEDIHCHALNTAGCARAQLGDAEGVREIEQSIQLARELNSAPLLLRGYNNLSAALGWLGETTRERQAHEEGLRVAERFGQTRAAGILRGNLPWAFWRTGDWEVALRLANGFVAEVEAGEPSMLEQRWREIRLRIWFARGLTDDALAEISELIRAIRESEYQGETFAIAGRVFQALGRMSEAHELADEILELGRERPATLTVPDAAVLMTELGRADEFLSSLGAAPKTRWRELAVQIAEGRYEEAAEVFGELGDTSFAADMWLLAGARLHREDRLAEAVDPLERALGFYRSVGATRYIADAERLLADATAATPGRAEQSR